MLGESVLFVLGFLKAIWYIRIHIGLPTGLKHPEIMNMLGTGLPHKQIEKLKAQIDPEIFPRAFRLLFNNTYHENDAEVVEHVLHLFAIFFPL